MHRSDSEVGPAAKGAAVERVPAPDALASPSRDRAAREVAEYSEARPVCVTVWRRVDAEVAEAFDAVMPWSERDTAEAGATVLEALRPGLLRYAVVPTDPAPRIAVERIDGRLNFARGEDGGTVIRWTYALHARRGRRPLVRLFAPLWRRQMTRKMQRITSELRAGT